jgi:hypothetical protein
LKLKTSAKKFGRCFASEVLDDFLDSGRIIHEFEIRFEKTPLRKKEWSSRPKPFVEM